MALEIIAEDTVDSQSDTTLVIKIGKRHIGAGDLFFMVEEGQFNQGNIEQAKRMIKLVAETGADAIEFQLAIADDFYVSGHPGHAIYKGREFNDDQLKELVYFSQSNGLELIVSPLSAQLAGKMAMFGCSAFNINASDLNNPSMLRAVMDTRLPFFLSIALASEKEILWATDFIQVYSSTAEFVLLHGQHTMATGQNGVHPAYTSLGYISTLKQRLGTPVGFVDHTPYSWFPACAVAAGADVVTKHMAPDHTERGPDWHICLDPGEMREAIRWAREMRRSICEQKKVLAPGEEMDRSEMRRSIVADRDLREGQLIRREDLAFKRPGNGLAPDREEDIVGCITTRFIKKNEILSIHMYKRKKL
jgi:sialic acid synthase SpsE